MGFSDFSVKKLEISLGDPRKTPEERKEIQLQIESLKKDQEVAQMQRALHGDIKPAKVDTSGVSVFGD